MLTLLFILAYASVTLFALSLAYEAEVLDYIIPTIFSFSLIMAVYV